MSKQVFQMEFEGRHLQSSTKPKRERPKKKPMARS